MLKKILLFLFLLTVTGLIAQEDNTEEAISIPMIQVTYGMHIPGNDLAERYGWNNSAGGSFMYMTKKNWLIGAEFNYLFGENINNKEDILANISTDGGQIIDGNGMFATVTYQERGFYANVNAGKLFALSSKNKNSGLFITAGLGLLQHKTLIQNPENKAPQISHDYTKGYDRLTNGLAISQFVGYMHVGEKQIYSFFAGVEMIQAWTESRRDYNFTLMKEDNSQRFDALYGLRIGWIIPLFRPASDEYYY
ncbi:MAG: hypothetical protein R6T91_10360 [Bacteroidales bacterium]